MQILRAFRHRDIQLLWSGQVFSAIGDEVYGIAIVWYAATFMGTGAVYLSAIQAASISIFSLLGGALIDHRDNRHVMIASDIVRAIAVLSLPLSTIFGDLKLWLIISVAIIVSSLSAFFTPALNSLLPNLIKEKKLLQATNGLMETTGRLARVIGPGIIGLLSTVVPFIHYFTLNALSFFISAVSIGATERQKPHTAHRLRLRDTLLAGHHLVKSKPMVRYVIFSGAIAGSAWNFILPLGMTLLVRERVPQDLGALGFLISAYGVGNIISNVVVANIEFVRPERWMFSGRILAGLGFTLLVLSQNLNQMMLSAAIAAAAGPIVDLGYINLIQANFQGTRYCTAFALFNGYRQWMFAFRFLAFAEFVRNLLGVDGHFDGSGTYCVGWIGRVYAVTWIRSVVSRLQLRSN